MLILESKYTRIYETFLKVDLSPSLDSLSKSSYLLQISQASSIQKSIGTLQHQHNWFHAEQLAIPSCNSY